MLKAADPEAINKDQTESGRETMLKKIYRGVQVSFIREMIRLYFTLLFQGNHSTFFCLLSDLGSSLPDSVLRDSAQAGLTTS